MGKLTDSLTLGFPYDIAYLVFRMILLIWFSHFYRFYAIFVKIFRTFRGLELQKCFFFQKKLRLVISFRARLFLSTLLFVWCFVGDSLNSAYWPLLQELFHADNCVGIIGGKPRHSLYFVGYQKEKLLYLDPHFCQSSVDMRATYFPTDSFRCSYPRLGQLTPDITSPACSSSCSGTSRGL